MGLTWDNVNFNKKEISIEKTIQRIEGSTVVTDPKTKNSSRTITLPQGVMTLLRQYKIEQKEYALKMGSKRQGNNWLFIQENGKVMHPSTPNHKLHEIIELYNAAVKDERLKAP